MVFLGSENRRKSPKFYNAIVPVIQCNYHMEYFFQVPQSYLSSYCDLSFVSLLKKSPDGLGVTKKEC